MHYFSNLYDKVLLKTIYTQYFSEYLEYFIK